MAFAAPPMPDSRFELMPWAAWWAAPVAAHLGLLRSWRRGDGETAREIAEGLPVFVAALEREKALP